jgi:hypothetical protein
MFVLFYLSKRLFLRKGLEMKTNQISLAICCVLPLEFAKKLSLFLQKIDFILNHISGFAHKDFILPKHLSSIKEQCKLTLAY